MTQSSGWEVVSQAQASAEDLGPDDVTQLLDSGGAVVVDVREIEEWRNGHIPGAVHIPRSFLELQVDEKLPDKDAPLVLYCGTQTRSVLAAKTLTDLGYSNVRHMRGGITAWREKDLPIELPPQWTAEQRDRYSRHFALPEVGEEGQEKISAASVMVVGAGGLGSPVLYYLAAAGVGHIGIVDNDVVEVNNLQRQIIHSTASVGLNKASSAEATVAQMNPDVDVRSWPERLTDSNVSSILEGFDVVIDATDNFETRYLLNQTAVDQRKPYVYGSIFRFEGFASVFWPAEGGPCYRCLHPEAPPPDLAPT